MFPWYKDQENWPPIKAVRRVSTKTRPKDSRRIEKPCRFQNSSQTIQIRYIQTVEGTLKSTENWSLLAEDKGYNLCSSIKFEYEYKII
jgi:hypothetical protein